MTYCPMCALFEGIHHTKENTMTNPDLTAIALIVDRSGSMSAIQVEAQAAINSFIKEQKDQDGEFLFWLSDFDDRFAWVWRNVPKSSVYDSYELIPRNFTCLYGAMGKTIDDLGSDLAAMPEGERPGKVIVATITDGAENSSPLRDWSKGWTYARLQEAIKRQQKEWNWEFLFLSSEPAAIDQAVRLNIPRVNTITIDSDPVSYMAGTAAMGQTVSHYRGTGTVKVEDNDLRGKVKSDDA